MQHHGMLFAYAWLQSTEDWLKMHNTGREQHISASALWMSRMHQIVELTRMTKPCGGLKQAAVLLLPAIHQSEKPVPLSVTMQGKD